jgi:hypothetical protein
MTPAYPTGYHSRRLERDPTSLAEQVTAITSAQERKIGAPHQFEALNVELAREVLRVTMSSMA